MPATLKEWDLQPFERFREAMGTRPPHSTYRLLASYHWQNTVP
jgi:hypothetical protein